MNQPQKPNKGGRPFVDFDWSKLNIALGYGARLIDCADHLDCSEDVIQNRIKEKYNISFSEYRNRKMSKMRLSVMQKQYDLAMSGNPVMLIWLGKQLLEQKDKQEIDHSVVRTDQKVPALAYAIKEREVSEPEDNK